MKLPLGLDVQEITSAFLILFAVIDIFGSVPIILSLKQKEAEAIMPGKAALYSLITFLAFLFMGNAILRLFHVDISSFAVAGALVLFVVGAELTFGVEIFHYDDSPEGSSTLVPLVFPLIAGAASFTTLLSLRAEYALANILIALLLNILLIYLVIRHVDLIERLIGKGGLYILRKFSGIIILAISVKLFTSNLAFLLQTLN